MALVLRQELPFVYSTGLCRPTKDKKQLRRNRVALTHFLQKDLSSPVSVKVRRGERERETRIFPPQLLLFIEQPPLLADGATCSRDQLLGHRGGKSSSSVFMREKGELFLKVFLFLFWDDESVFV